MITIIFSIVIMIALWEAGLFLSAPEGWEDERGFHEGKPDDSE